MKLNKIDRKFKEICFEKTQDLYNRLTKTYKVVYDDGHTQIVITNDPEYTLTAYATVIAYNKETHKAVGLSAYELKLCLKKLKQLNKNKLIKWF